MKWENSIVKIKVKSTEIDLKHPLNIFGTETSSGTGFFFCNNKKLILTCYHVVKFAVDIEVIYNYKNNCKAEILYIFPDDDLAIIIIDKDYSDIVPLRFIEIKYDENYDVFTIGYPLNSKTIKISKGIISGYQESLIQTDATLNSGNSGGPLVLKKKEKYYVIGVNVSKMVNNNAEKTGFVVPFYRFKILNNMIISCTKEIINKPVMYFSYQKLIQEELINEIYKDYELYKTKQIGVRITFINQTFYISKFLKANDIILKVNDKELDYNGYVKFDFFPEKINIDELGLWFAENDDIIFTVLRDNKEIIISFKLKIIDKNLIDYHNIPSSKKYYINKNGLIISAITESHLDNIFDKLNLPPSKIIKILNRYLFQKDLFTIYLADIDFNYNNIFHKFPIGDIIIEINNKKIENYNDFINIETIKSIKTIDNEIYYVN